MNQASKQSPITHTQLIDAYFLEHRAKLIDIAAFLDRMDRVPSDSGQEDFRLAAFRAALRVVANGHRHRAKRVLTLLSDPTDTRSNRPGRPRSGRLRFNRLPGVARASKYAYSIRLRA